MSSRAVRSPTWSSPPAEPERRRRVALQRRAVDVVEPPPVRFDPGQILAAQEPAASGEERDQRRAPRARPLTLRDRRFSSVDRLVCRLEVDPGVGREDQPDLAPPLTRSMPTALPQPRENGAQRTVGVGRHVVRPERVDEFLPARVAVTVEHQVGEQEATLAPRNQLRDRLTGDLHREPPADLDSGRGLVRQGCGKENVRKFEPPPRAGAIDTWRRGAMAKQIICQCGFVGRGETAADAAAVIELHMQSDHPELVGEVSKDDLLAMAEEA